MNAPRAKFLLCVLGACLLPTVGFAQQQAELATAPLGRLFLNPQQRTQLDQQRRLGISNAQVQALRYDGMLRRHGGKTILWLNGQPLDDAQSAARVDSNNRLIVRLPSGQGEHPIQLQVGDEVLPDGSRNAAPSVTTHQHESR